MNFATLKGLTIPQGAVKQITDSSGRILWSASKPIVLTVEKVTATTYAGETTYNDEQFILLEIYPKTNGTVKVTYGGLTKTITDTSGVESPNGQKVYFGTFNGVSDSVATPSSGTLTIDGDCDSFACGSYSSGSKSYNIGYCSCITGVQEFGEITKIASYAFRDCTKLALTSLPSGITSIGSYAFYGCPNITLTSLPSGITSIGSYAFYECSTLTSLPSGITSIGDSAFRGCESLTQVTLQCDLSTCGTCIFEGCISLTDVYILSNCTTIKGYTFSGCSALRNVTISSSIKTIEEYAFEYCRMLDPTTVLSQAKITSIGDYAFYGCAEKREDITHIRIPNSVTTIGAKAFNSTFWKDTWSGDDLYTITIGSGIKSIGEGAFNNFNDNTDVVILATTPPSIVEASTFGEDKYDMLFGYVERIIVPKGYGATYKSAAGWSYYANYIVEA